MKLFREFDKRIDLDTCDKISDKILSEVKTNIEKGYTTPLFRDKNNVYSLDFVFTKDGILDLLKEYDYLKPFVDEVVDTATYNAFYLNALIIDDGNSVKKHLDTTLTDHTTPIECIAHRVFVLYLRVPEDMVGGELKVYLDDEVQSIKPETGKIVSFGSYTHSVDVTYTKHKRISLVLECYYLMENSYSKIPLFKKFDT
jgi:hypothetical protein